MKSVDPSHVQAAKKLNEGEREYGVKVFFKGMAMGAADAVPGVSGGTVAFISGIYEQLIESIHSINPGVVLLWRREGFSAVWQKVDGTFLLTLLAGILSSILLLAQIIGYLLLEHPILLSAFFFGLVGASVMTIYGEMQSPNWKTRFLLALGVILMFLVDQLMPALDAADPLQLFVAGSIAICAMILPGISGSFLLLMMGVYGGVMQAVKNFDLLAISWFAGGCIMGILSFSQVLNWLFHKFREGTLALLTGVLIGSLAQIWPWREVVAYKMDNHGKVIPISQDNLLPATYEQITGMSSQLAPALILMVLGFSLVWFFNRQAKK